MNESELRQAITGLKQVSIALGQPAATVTFDEAVSALDDERVFAAYTKFANGAANLVGEAKDPALRSALVSLAYLGYSYCVENSKGRANFQKSRDWAHAETARLGGAKDVSAALSSIRECLAPAEVSVNVAAAGASSPSPLSSDPVPGEVVPSTEAMLAEVVSLDVAAIEEPAVKYFEEAISVPPGVRIAQLLLEWHGGEVEKDSTAELERFERRLQVLLRAGEQGRQFGEFTTLDEDLAGLRSELCVLDVPTSPNAIQRSAAACRALTAINFKSADEITYRSARRCWLVSAFWNSCLTELWPTNQEQFVYDVLGYLTAVQAEHRYAMQVEDVLLLLRVSHLICRIASNDELVARNFYEKSGIETWIRHTVGTVLAISGPGRVPPFRINNDPRFVDERGREIDRDRFGSILLPLWRNPDEREAACSILLELAGWSLAGSQRMTHTVLSENEDAYEIWAEALAKVVDRAENVKVVRPNPWEEGAAGRTVTANTHALAVLASDVIHRTFPSLESTISLDGTSFRERRVPTFVCSADFGPLGLFKADARERIGREAENFTCYAQRLHPRYRASRCDKSVAMISEPDDRIEFVSGLLTSYVFTANEAPRSLNAWFRESDASAVAGLLSELFDVAVTPWYRHATLGVLDILTQYEQFTRQGLDRQRLGLEARGDLEGADQSAIRWLEQIGRWVSGEPIDADTEIQDQAAQLQLCETLKAITHGDLHLENVMVLGRPGAEYPCLIDFEATGPAHLLRDFGRFVGAVFFRTFVWDEVEREQISKAVALGAASEFASVGVLSGDEGPNVVKVVETANAVWRSYLQHWRGGSRPRKLEVTATLVCTFLPFARYPDTDESAARLALSVAGQLVRGIWSGTGLEDGKCAES